MTRSKIFPLLFLLSLSAHAFALDRELSRSIFAELISIDTTNEHGNTTRAAQAMKNRLLAAGISEQNLWLGGSAPDKQNLVMRMPGNLPWIQFCYWRTSMLLKRLTLTGPLHHFSSPRKTVISTAEVPWMTSQWRHTLSPI